MIQKELVDLLGQKIVPQGSLRIATDWAPYAEHIESVLSDSEEFVARQDDINELRIETRLGETKFEIRGKRLGHNIVDFWYALNPKS